ncbi:HlyD family type I secretion periplasmic adaptor subunit [Sphingomonas sp. QA11]|uniref:HlyD family type I secretion periplasmic adaptor subunit n=1 Tax=Sphingomonas sp. QA11 TaxID=2950605 RepID=UPI002349D2BA|nr:HlyD family type I secretion periplasmic adaptor subunit [Sphingomonas sp. QA11]WCM25844.1 HlyD family type I secretion periplasmic adaptor subunit [Sphingomonas sp. QA11]
MSLGSTLAERFPTLARHLAVLRLSWRMQDDADRNRKPVTDHEFLPAALEIMEKPPSPGLRWLTLALCALFAIAIIWSIFGKVDVVAVATGKVIPAANVKLIQPIEIGAVRAIHVRNGQHVKKGQLLVELDSTLTAADEAQASQGLLSANIVGARNNALLAHLSGRPRRFVAPPGTPAVIAGTQEQFIATSVGEYEAQRASLLQSKAESAAGRAGAEAEIAKLKQTLPLVERQLEARRELSEKGYFSKIRLLEYEQLRLEHIQNIAVQEANAAKAAAAMANYDAQIARLRATFGKTAVTDLSEAQDKSSMATQELNKSSRRRQYQQLRAPVDGTVQQLSIATVGGVVEPAKPIMVIVPDDAAIEVEAQILNKDIGFVREGQAVRVKLEAYPFTDYGLIEGIVESISRDAIDFSQQGAGAARDSNGKPPPTGLVYAARIRLNQRTIRVGNREQLIGPGLSVQAEIKTGERRIIQYLISPIAQTMDEAARER